MSRGHILVLVHTMHVMPWDIPIPLHSISKVPVYHGVNIETDIFMSPGHILVPAHNIGSMSLGHTDTLILCIKTSCISWCQD